MWDTRMVIMLLRGMRDLTILFNDRHISPTPQFHEEG
jgi:hypothetical protein